MTRMLLFSETIIKCSHAGYRQLEDESSARSRTGALRRKCAAHFLGGQGAAVQTEAVTVTFCCEAMREDSHDVLRSNASTVVLNAHADAIAAERFNSEHEPPFFASLFLHRVFGVPHKIDKDLQDFVFIDCDERYFGVFANHLNAMPLERSRINLKGILGQLRD